MIFYTVNFFKIKSHKLQLNLTYKAQKEKVFEEAFYFTPIAKT